METHCCERMAQQLNHQCDKHPNRNDCPDALTGAWNSKYFILVHDGGSSGVEINFCPWCGTNLRTVSHNS